MKWPSIDDLSGMAPLPLGYRYEILNRSGVSPLIEAIRVWHPDIAVGGGSCYLREDFYARHVHFDGEEHKDVFVGVQVR